MTRILEYSITKDFENMTILAYLKSLGFSRQCVIALKKQEKGILLNGVWAYVNNTLSVGDILTLTLSDEESSEKIPPIKLPLDILYEDDNIIVVDKPSGLLSVPGKAGVVTRPNYVKARAYDEDMNMESAERSKAVTEVEERKKFDAKKRGK